MRLIGQVRNAKAGIITLFGQFEILGKWEPDKIINNVLIDTPIELDVFARPLWINQFSLEGNVTHMTIGNDQIRFSAIPGSDQQLSGVVAYPNFPAISVQDFSLIENGVEKFHLEGEIGKLHWDYRITSKETDASMVMGLVDLPTNMKGRMDIHAEGKGSSADPFITAKVAWRDGAFGVVPLDLASFKFRLKEGVAEIIDLAAYSKQGYSLTGDLRFGTDLLPENRIVSPSINLKLSKGNMEILESMWSDCEKAKGSFDGEIHMWEEKSGFKAEGFFEARDVSLKTRSYTPVVKNGNFLVSMAQNQIKIERGEAKIGKGNFLISGFIGLGDQEPDTVDLFIKTPGRGIAIQVPELTIPPGPLLGRFKLFQKEFAGFSKGDLSLDLTLKGPFDHPSIKGNIFLENSVFTYPPVEIKGREKPRKSAFTRWLQGFLANMDWDVGFKTGNRTIYENDLVYAFINGTMGIQGPASDLKINGRIISQQGSIIYAGNEFKINSAVLEIITEAPKMRPGDKSQTLVYLTVNAQREVYYTDVSGNSVSDIIIMEVDRSQFGEIQPRFKSKNNPELPSQKALLLALGIPPTSSLDEAKIFQNQSATPKSKEDMDLFLRASLVQLVDSSFASPLARTVARRTGLVDTIRISYQAPDVSEGQPSNASQTLGQGATGTNPQSGQWWRNLRGTKVKLGREISRGFFADYSFKFDEFQNQLDFRHEVELAYQLQKNLFLRATSELDSQRTLGRDPERKAILEKWWRFGLPKKKISNEVPSPLATPTPQK